MASNFTMGFFFVGTAAKNFWGAAGPEATSPTSGPDAGHFAGTA